MIGDMPENMELHEKRILITAHAGCVNTECDSIESVYAGIRAGADIVEVDVRFTDDGTPVLSHDPVTGDKQKELVALDDVFNAIKKYPDIFMNLDLKEKNHIESLHKLILSVDLKDRIILTGVEPQHVELIRKYCPDVLYLLNYDPDPAKIFMNNSKYIRGLVDMTVGSKAIGINLYYLFATEQLIEEFHNAGMKVFVWTVEGKEDIEEMIHRKVDSITSCQVDLLAGIVKQKENLMEME